MRGVSGEGALLGACRAKSGREEGTQGGKHVCWGAGRCLSGRSVAGEGSHACCHAPGMLQEKLGGVGKAAGREVRRQVFACCTGRLLSAKGVRRR